MKTLLLYILELSRSNRRGKKILQNPRAYGIIKMTGFGKYNFDDTQKTPK